MRSTESAIEGKINPNNHRLQGFLIARKIVKLSLEFGLPIAAGILLSLMFFAPQAKAATVNELFYSDTASGSEWLYFAQWEPNITATNGSITSIKVNLKRHPSYEWSPNFPTTLKPGLVLFDEYNYHYCGYADKSYEEIGNDWTQVTFTFNADNRLDLSEHRVNYAISNIVADWKGCGSSEASGHLLVQADGPNKWTVEVYADFLAELSFSFPKPNIFVDANQEFTVIGTCPNNGENQLAITANQDWTLPENQHLATYNINCVNHIWTAKTTLSSDKPGIYVIDKQSKLTAYLPLSVVSKALTYYEVYKEDSVQNWLYYITGNAGGPLLSDFTATTGQLALLEVPVKRLGGENYIGKYPSVQITFLNEQLPYQNTVQCVIADNSWAEIGNEGIARFNLEPLNIYLERLHHEQWARITIIAGYFVCNQPPFYTKYLDGLHPYYPMNLTLYTKHSPKLNLAFTSPAENSTVTIGQEFTVSGTCPNNGENQLALAFNESSALPENQHFSNFIISCVNNTWTASVTSFQDSAGIYVMDKLSTSYSFLPLNVNVKTPILIVPGMIGSELYDGDDKVWLDLGQMFWDVGDGFLIEKLGLDEDGQSKKVIKTGDIIRETSLLTFHQDTFKGLIDSLEFDNYQAGYTYFVFPYDWRQDLVKTKDKLKQKIEEIKFNTGSSKVDIISHSMGGLLTKAYLDQYGKNNIGKLIFVGTPHLGAPKSGKTLVEGDNFYLPWVNANRIEELVQNMASMYELLPSQAYFDIFQGYLEPYKFLNKNVTLWNYDETKDFYLNKVGKNSTLYKQAEDFWAKNLHDYDFSGIDTYNITGCRIGTYATYKINMNNDGISMNGRLTSGDGTVPMVSARYINIDSGNKYYVKDVGHSSLPSADGVKELILGILKDNIILKDNVSRSIDFCNFKGKELTWRSPVEVHIYDQSNNHTGPVENNGIEYGISGVNYEIIGDDMVHGEKQIFLPTDEGQQYEVVVKGLDTGTFDYRVSEVDNGQYLTSYIYNDVSVNTTTQFSINISESSLDDALNINFNGSNQEVKANTTLEGDKVSDLIPPETTVVATGTTEAYGWFKSNVVINLDARDDNNEILETKYKLDDNMTYRTYSGSLGPISAEGDHIIKYYSVDEAGNNEEIKTFEFKIDKTAPEISIKYDLDSKDFVFKAVDYLDSEAGMVCGQTSCEAKDASGNTTVLKFHKFEALLYYLLKFESVVYNGVEASLQDNYFMVKYQDNKDILKDFNQAILTKDQEIVRVDYKRNNNESKVFDTNRELENQRYSLLEVHLIELLTNKDKLNINIK